jgi:hypothetical protein
MVCTGSRVTSPPDLRLLNVALCSIFRPIVQYLPTVIELGVTAHFYTLQVSGRNVNNTIIRLNTRNVMFTHN